MKPHSPLKLMLQDVALHEHNPILYRIKVRHILELLIDRLEELEAKLAVIEPLTHRHD